MIPFSTPSCTQLKLCSDIHQAEVKQESHEYEPAGHTNADKQRLTGWQTGKNSVGQLWREYTWIQLFFTFKHSQDNFISLAWWNKYEQIPECDPACLERSKRAFKQQSPELQTWHRCSPDFTRSFVTVNHLNHRLSKPELLTSHASFYMNRTSTG